MESLALGKRSHVDLDFASADSAMGHTADLALGIALARPERKVICLNGDGSMLMTLGTLVTAARQRPGTTTCLSFKTTPMKSQEICRSPALERWTSA